MEENKEINEKSNVSLYENYFTKLYVTIPKNCALIVRNKFNGKRVNIKEGGFAILLPFQEAKLVSLAVKNFDLPKQTFEDVKGQDIVVDIAVTIKIVDPIKYEYENKDVHVQLKQMLSSIMRTFISKFDYEFLKYNRFTLPKSGSIVRQMSNGEELYLNPYTNEYGELVGKKSSINFSSSDTELERKQKVFQQCLVDARIELDQFAKKYGLAIEDLYSNEIQQTAAMQEAYNKKIIAEQEREAELIKKQTQLESAEKDAQIERVKAQASADAKKYELEVLFNILKDSNLSSEQINNIIQAYMYSKNEKANVFVDSNSNNPTQAGIVAAVTSENISSQKTR